MAVRLQGNNPYSMRELAHRECQEMLVFILAIINQILIYSVMAIRSKSMVAVAPRSWEINTD